MPRSDYYMYSLHVRAYTLKGYRAAVAGLYQDMTHEEGVFLLACVYVYVCVCVCEQEGRRESGAAAAGAQTLRQTTKADP